MKALLTDAATRGARYPAGLDERRVYPTDAEITALDVFDVPLAEEPAEPERILDELDRIGSPATVATAGPRYFGFVTGGALPASVAAGVLASAWDQSAAFRVTSPVGTRLEQIATRWAADLLGLSEGVHGACVTGTTMANFAALAAARHALLARAGWNVENDGLFGAPPLTVIVGEEAHASLIRSLGMAGLGRRRVQVVPVDAQGAMRADAMPRIEAPTIVCAQAGNVDTGAIDPFDAIAGRLEGTGAWLHVDGAFGLWAAAAPSLRERIRGVERADSWATDAHKWLNVPYDSGLLFIRDRGPLGEAMAMRAPYLDTGEVDPFQYTPDASRRARGIELWAALRSLGRRGVAELIERNCRLARRFSEGVGGLGFEVLNEVVLNQVLVAFGDDNRTRSVIGAVQREGTMWAGASQWRGRVAMRISVSSWATTDDDVDRCVATLERVNREITGTP